MDETLIKVQKRTYKLPYYDEIIKFQYLPNKNIKVSIL